MAVRHFTDLIAWQLIDELRRETIAFTAVAPVSSDVTEGFARFRPAEFVRFLQFSTGSLSEVQDLLIEAREKKYASDEQFERLWLLSKRASVANVRLIQSQQQRVRPTRTR
ncbi:MAG TPA: four helix bundle protein [Vicinamibacterales bacterium]|jgi:four helix bundle protein